jgi:type IV pilus assembly protein PilC
MATFVYQCKDQTGRFSKGQLEAGSLREAATKLREENLYITNLQPLGLVQARSKRNAQPLFGSGVKLKDLLVFTRQFSVMIGAGVNLVSCLNILADQTENKFLAAIIHDIRREVENGSPLHAAIAKHDKAFPPLYIHMVEAGEASGQLDVVLQRVGEYLEREFALRKKVTGAMVYPAVIVLVAIVVVTILMTVVIPQFLTMFRDAGAQLPLMTRLLIGVIDFMQHFWYLIFGALFGGIAGFFYYRNTPQGRYVTDKLFYRMMIFGPVIQKVASARFSRTLSTLLESGVMITNSLELVEKAVGNTVIARAVATARQNITRGSGLAIPLEQTGTLPRMVTQMIAVGEETGELTKMLDQVAEFYEKEAAYAVEGLTSLIEPAIIVVLGGIVAVIVSAIMLPLFDISTGATMK